MLMNQTANDTIRATIVSRMRDVASEQNLKLAPLADNLPLMESGLDSLSLAVLVASLDDQLGIDPFSGDQEVDFPVTVGDFIKLYENAMH